VFDTSLAYAPGYSFPRKSNLFPRKSNLAQLKKVGLRLCQIPPIQSPGTVAGNGKTQTANPYVEEGCEHYTVPAKIFGVNDLHRARSAKSILRQSEGLGQFRAVLSSGLAMLTSTIR